MTHIFGLFYAMIAGALLLGQVKVVRRALSQKMAGLGRFTYSLSEAPTGFWVMLVLEIAGMLAVALYFVGALAVVLK